MDGGPPVTAFLIAHEGALRLGAFAGLLGAFALLEQLKPRRPVSPGRWRQWPVNLGLMIGGALTLRLLVPLLAVGAALWAEAAGVGLFNQRAVPFWAEALISLLLLDLMIYAQHRAFHRVPLLWRLHAVHHTDRDLDVSTAVRLHPVEILLSMGLKMGVVAALGVAPAVVILFEILLNGFSLFNHVNLRLPQRADRLLRKLIVTPDMHRVHHSVYPGEHHRNFGFCLSLWDRIFGTYVAQPRDGHETMRLGLFRDMPARSTLLTLLAFPLRREPPR